ncbi:uncharacterized protein SRS1_15896 [Sporisorium reilianum f. sp. reilianum]|uniref:Uncharacterized protein n=1 Tax=Sporisorium reilianum f. sp. reilianum TaxID=72559 RepID=A0A2N8UJY0_9BASI|nr:uncharacterized protein SRS1_15896 [Sporisorium reilianum f. sp. reilianum]
MPTVERISLPQSLSAVANKGRRLFSRETTLTSNDAQSRSTTPLRASALNLNEALEQAWVSSASPYCLSNQLLSPQSSVSGHAQEWGRRRSSNTTTASTSSSTGFAPEAPQRRRKSLFSKKPRSEHLADDAIQQDLQSTATHFVDPFARQAQHDASPSTALKLATQDDPSPPADRSSQRLSIKQQQKKEALDRISDLICLSVEHQTQLPRSQIGATSPRTISTSPSMSDSTFFYPVEAPPSPHSLTSSSNSSSSERRASIVAFPSRIDSSRGLRLNMSGDTHSTPNASSLASPSMSAFSTQADLSLQGCDRSFETCLSRMESSFEHHQLLLPSSMKRQPSRTIENDASKRSNASLRAEVGHGSDRILCSNGVQSQTSSEWLRMEEVRRSLQPPPPLRPSRNPMRSRSKSLGSPRGASRPASPPPPMPPLPAASPSVNTSGLVGPHDLTPVHTPPRSRPVSSLRHHGRARCDSLTSAASSASLRAASFHTPTFGTASWTTLPMS